jgi:hypothetical protein
MNAVSLVLLSLLAQAAPQVDNPEAKARAQALLKEGTQRYQQGAFADALEKFEQAYAVFPSPKLLFNIGKASRELGRPVDAVDAFEKFVAQVPDAAPELIAEAKRSVEELAPKIGKLLVDCTLAGAEITVDGRQIGWAPLVDMIRLAPGSHQVTATHPSATPAIQNVIVTAGSVATVVMRPQPIGVAAPVSPAPYPTTAPPGVDLQTAWPPAKPAADKGWWLGRKWTWVAAGSTVVFAGGATIAGLMMQSKFDSLKSSCGTASARQQGCTQSDLSALDTRRNAANVMWGLAGAAALTAGVLFFVEGRPVTIAPLAGRTTGLLTSVRY